MLVGLFFLVAFTSLTNGLSQVCFVLTTSTVRRDSIGVVSAASQIHCNIQCVAIPGCDACMFYTDRIKCVFLGAARAPPQGSCSTAYTCYEKRTSGCPVYSSPMVDRAYTPGPCSRLSDVVGPPIIGPIPTGLVQRNPCGRPPIGQRRIILDAELHDGSRLVLENEGRAVVDWDQYLDSWYYLLVNVPYYFKRATCVRPPTTPLSPSCDCAPLPSVQPMLPGAIPSLILPSIGPPRVCPGNVQIYYKNSRQVFTLFDQGWFPSDQDYVYCAMGVWININEVAPVYNEAAIIAATCTSN